MGELGDKVDADAKAKLEEKRLKLKEATEKDDYDAMKTLLEELQQELYTVGASVYQQAGAEAGASPDGEADPGTGAAGSTGASDDVIDAEFTESK
jgi:molecular chaperone DnaK